MLITSPKPQDSVIFIDDEQYIVSCSKYKTQGLKDSMENMFQNLSKEKINEVICKTSLSDTKPQKKCEIAKIEPFLFRKEGLWCNAADMQGYIYENVAEIIGLIVWLENKHFKNRSDILRKCLICENLQEGEIVGYGNMSRHPLVKWPSDYCLNPKCFSHEIWKAINPDYTVPKNTPSIKSRLEEKMSELDTWSY